MTKKLNPISPGEILLEEYMNPLGISQNKLGRDIDVPPNRINEIIKGKRAITTDTAVRLAIYFKTTPNFWINMQTNYELEMLEDNLIPEIEKIIRPYTH